MFYFNWEYNYLLSLILTISRRAYPVICKTWMVHYYHCYGTAPGRLNIICMPWIVGTHKLLQETPNKITLGPIYVPVYEDIHLIHN